MTDVDERFERVEQRLDSVEKSVGEVREEVRGLRGEVGDLRGEVGTLRGEVGTLRGEVGTLRDKVDGLGDEVHKLRVIVEAHDEGIRRIAEVQAYHGRQLEQITEDLKPLREIRDVIKVLAGDHERRITALEKQVNR